MGICWSRLCPECWNTSTSSEDNLMSDMDSSQATNSSEIPSYDPNSDAWLRYGSRVDADCLTKNLVILCKDMVAKEVLTHLESKKIISSVEADEIRATKTLYDANQRLIALVMKRGPDASYCFTIALEETGQQHLSRILLATYMKIHDTSSSDENQAPTTSSRRPFQPNIKDRQQLLATAQQTLKKMYLRRFKKVHPFSLPFTFDIEKTWVSLSLKEEKKDSQATEDHAELLKRAFDKVEMLIIEGNPATGKTSLMRRLAYEWAKEEDKLLHYDLVLYAEFREVQKQKFESIVDLVLDYTKKFIEYEEFKDLKSLLSKKRNRKQRKFLVLLDGYDESSLDKQCTDLTDYLNLPTIKKPLELNVVITTRPSYLTTYRGNKGQYVFADVLGFATAQQKKSYIFNHFKSADSDTKKNIKAVHSLLAYNENLNKLAETPLFLTFICLVHERIIDGTLVELYCNIIWWLIDRYQKNNPDHNISALFEFNNDCNDKVITIQDHYLHFPQLHCLGKMALHNLEKDEFKPPDYKKFNLQPIIEQVGLLRKERNYDTSFKVVTSFFFPHRTIQEFLAALYCFCSDDSTSKWLLPNSNLDTSEEGMNEFERFLIRIALSDKMPIQTEKRKYYFERIAQITDIVLDMTTFDAFNTTAGFNNQLLTWFLSQCTTLQNIKLRGIDNGARHKLNKLNDTSVQNETAITSKMFDHTLFSFSELIKLHSVTFYECTFEANSQLSFTNCPSLKNLQFNRCEMKGSSNLGIAALLAIETVQFDECKSNLATWESIADQIRNSAVRFLKLEFGKDFKNEFLTHLQKCNNVQKMEITIRGYTIRQNDLFSLGDMIKLDSLTFGGEYLGCTFQVNSQLSFMNYPSLKNLKFKRCEMKGSIIVGIAKLPAINTVEFYQCKIDLVTWQTITDQIRNSSVKCLKLSADYFVEKKHPEFLRHLLKCDRIQQIHVKDIMDSESKSILNRDDEVTASLVQTAQKLQVLTSITILDWNGKSLDENRRLKEKNKKRIEKAGQKRNPDFSIKYVK